MKNLYEIVEFVDTINSTFGDEIYSILDYLKEGDSEHPLLVDGVNEVHHYGLTLENTEDFYAVTDGTGWKRVSEYGEEHFVGKEQEFIAAIYVQYEGTYAFVVGDVTGGQILATKEVPPL